LVVFLVLCYYFQPWMLPVAGLLIFLKQYIVGILAGPSAIPWDETADSDIDDDDDDDKEKVVTELQGAQSTGRKDNGTKEVCVFTEHNSIKRLNPQERKYRDGFLSS
jgi:hypothetical protein